jgi:DnaJ-class molecular chaperone
MIEEINKLRAENVKLRDYLLFLANSCPECDGTGTTALADDRIGPCPDCAGIRRVLA